MTVVRKIIAGFFWAMAAFGLFYARDFWTPLITAAIGYAIWPWQRRSSVLGRPRKDQ